MTKWLVFDTNLLLLLVVGRAGEHLVAGHKRLRSDYTAEDFRNVERIVGGSAGIIVVPHVLAEVSNLARQIDGPARRSIMEAFSRMIDDADEVWIASKQVVEGPHLDAMGLTDAVLLRTLAEPEGERLYRFLTADQPLALQAEAMGFDVINYLELGPE